MPGQALRKWVAVAPNQTAIKVGKFFNDAADEGRQIVVDGVQAALDFVPNRIRDAGVVLQDTTLLIEKLKASLRALPPRRDSQEPVHISRSEQAKRASFNDLQRLDRSVNAALVNAAQDAAPVLKPIALGALAPVVTPLTAGLVTPAMLSPLLLFEPLADMGKGLISNDGKVFIKGFLTAALLSGAAWRWRAKRGGAAAGSSNGSAKARVAAPDYKPIMRDPRRIERFSEDVENRIDALYRSPQVPPSTSAMDAFIRSRMMQALETFQLEAIESRAENSLLVLAQEAAARSGAPRAEVENLVFGLANKIKVRGNRATYQAVQEANARLISPYEERFRATAERLAARTADIHDLFDYAYLTLRLMQTYAIERACMSALK